MTENQVLILGLSLVAIWIIGLCGYLKGLSDYSRKQRPDVPVVPGVVFNPKPMVQLIDDPDVAKATLKANPKLKDGIVFLEPEQEKPRKR